MIAIPQQDSVAVLTKPSQEVREKELCYKKKIKIKIKIKNKNNKREKRMIGTEYKSEEKSETSTKRGISIIMMKCYVQVPPSTPMQAVEKRDNVNSI
jgi:uncharacterized membrane protein